VVAKLGMPAGQQGPQCPVEGRDWHALAGQVGYVDPGLDHFQRLEDPETQKRRLIRQLEALGVQVTIQPAG
jgi:hypothetical protein